MGVLELEPGIDSKLNAVVDWWNEPKGHGFAKCEDGTPVFIHYRYFVLHAAGQRISLDVGQGLRLKVVQDPKGPRGEAIEIL